MVRTILAALTTALCLATASAAEIGRYSARVARVVDGDTIIVQIPVWPQEFNPISVRIAGVDTPEIRGRCQSERDRARAARAWLRTVLPPDTSVTVVWTSRDKYGGRIVGDVLTADGVSVSAEVLRLGHGRPYDGGRKMSWCSRS